MAGMSLGVSDKLSFLMYSYRHGMKKQYFMALESLKPSMEENLYEWFFRFGHGAVWKEGK